MNNYRFLHKILVVMLSIMGLSLPTIANNINWQGVNGSWDVPVNWDCNCIPGMSDTVFISSGEATIPSGYINAFRAASVIIEVGAKLIIETHVNPQLTGKLTVANDQYESIRVLGEILNKGKIIIPDAGIGMYIGPNGKFTNNGSGSILIDGATGNITHGFINTSNHFLNFGQITVTDILDDASNTGFTNFQGRIVNLGEINILNSVQINNSGYIINTLSGSMDLVSFEVNESDTLVNSGEIVFHSSASLILEPNSVVINEGRILSQATGGNFSAIIVESNGVFKNQECAVLDIKDKITNGGDFINYGYIFQDSGLPNINSGNFINHGVIEDLKFSFSSNMIDQNNGYLIQPILDVVSVGASVPNVISGLGNGVSVVGKRFGIDTTGIVTAGQFFEQINKTWVPDCAATNLTMVYMLMDNGNGCPQIISLPLFENIQPGESINTYLGPVQGNWHSIANWSLSYIPHFCHHVIIPEWASVTVTSGKVGRGGEVDILGELIVPLGARVNFKKE